MTHSPPERKVLSLRTRMKVLSDLNENLERQTKDRDKREELRRKAIDEIVSSEETYLKNLAITEKYFMQPLGENGLITSKLHKVLFGTFENIRVVNEELMKRLRDDDENVGKAFVELAPYYKHYSVYANNFKSALSLVEKLVKEDKLFGKFLRNQESRPEVGTTLMSLLIIPIQRIPRYKLLLDQVLQYTEKDSDDYRLLREAIYNITTVAVYIDDCISEHDNMQMLLNVQKCLYGGKPRIVIPGRRLIKQGQLNKVSQSGARSRQRVYLLFNDMLMCCKLRGNDATKPESLICSCVLPINHCKVKCLLGDGTSDGCLFKVMCKEETLILYSNNSSEGNAWVDALQSVIKQYADRRSTLRKESSGKRPLKRSAIVKEKIESLSQLNRQRHTQTGEASARDVLFPLRELQLVRDCILTPLKKRRPNSHQGDTTELATCHENGGGEPGISRERNSENSSSESLEVVQAHEIVPFVGFEEHEVVPCNPHNALMCLDEVIHMTPHSVVSLTGLISKMSEPIGDDNQTRNTCVLL